MYRGALCLSVVQWAMIGTDFTIVATGQGEEMDMHYTFTTDDELLMGDTLITKTSR